MEPLYVHVPSVRKEITSFMKEWFIHAIEAKGNSKLVSKLEKLDAPMAEKIRKRGIIGTSQYEGDIHFVIADNAAFYQERPVEETHTPEAVELAKKLNEIGNPHGVFIHYITPEEMIQLMPKKIPEAHPLFHVIGGGRVKIPPGAGTNIALTYIKTFHDTAKYDSNNVYLLRMDDDTYPGLTKIRSGNKWKYRNYFKDVREILFTGKVDTSTGGYKGAYDAYGIDIGNLKPKSNFLIRKMNLEETPYLATEVNEDHTYTPKEGTTHATPGYTTHKGYASTWNHENPKTSYEQTRGASFGNYLFSSERMVKIAKPSFVKSVLKKSGIKK